MSTVKLASKLPGQSPFETRSAGMHTPLARRSYGEHSYLNLLECTNELQWAMEELNHGNVTFSVTSGSDVTVAYEIDWAAL